MTWRKGFWCLLAALAVGALGGCTGFGTNCSTDADCEATNPEAVCDPTLKVCFFYNGPVVTTIAPANGAAGVASANANVVATFSRSIVDAGVTSTSFILAGQGFNTLGNYLVPPTQATFVPLADGLALGTNYAVSLTAAIKDGAGDTLLPFSSTFSTVDGTWGGGGTIRYPAGDWTLASDYFGRLVTAVDVAMDDGSYFNDFALAVGVSPAGTVPGITVSLQSIVGQQALSPRVAIANDGTAFVTWTTFPTDAGTPLAFTALGAVYDPVNENWGPPIVLAGPDPVGPQYPIVASSGFTAWIQDFAGTPLVFANSYNFATGNWTDAGTLQTDTSLAASKLSVSSDLNGNVLVAWQSEQPGNGPPEIFASYVPVNSGQPPPPVVLSNAPTLSSTIPFASLGYTGMGAVVWAAQNGTNDAGIPIVHIFASTFDPSRNPSFSAPVQLDKAASFANYPQVGVAANGNAIAFWQELGAVVSSTFTHATNSWSTPFTVDSDTTFAVNGPTIVVDPGGNGLAAWVKNSATDGFQMFGGRYTADGGWHGQQRITVGPDPVDDAYPALAVDVRGRGWSLLIREPTTEFYLQYVPFQ